MNPQLDATLYWVTFKNRIFLANLTVYAKETR